MSGSRFATNKFVKFEDARVIGKVTAIYWTVRYVKRRV